MRTFVLATGAVPIVIYGLMPQLHRLRGRLLWGSSWPQGGEAGADLGPGNREVVDGIRGDGLLLRARIRSSTWSPPAEVYLRDGGPDTSRGGNDRHLKRDGLGSRVVLVGVAFQGE